MRPLTDPAHPPDRQLNEHLKIIRLKSLFSAASTTRYGINIPSYGLPESKHCILCTPYSVQIHAVHFNCSVPVTYSFSTDRDPVTYSFSTDRDPVTHSFSTDQDPVTYSFLRIGIRLRLHIRFLWIMIRLRIQPFSLPCLKFVNKLFCITLAR